MWNGHEATGNVTSYVNDPWIESSHPGGPVEYDFHATMVGFTMVGLGPPVALPDGQVGYYYYQFGMAARTYSGVQRRSQTSFSSTTPGEFDISSQTLVYGYKTVMLPGVSRADYAGPRGDADGDAAGGCGEFVVGVSGSDGFAAADDDIGCVDGGGALNGVRGGGKARCTRPRRAGGWAGVGDSGPDRGGGAHVGFDAAVAIRRRRLITRTRAPTISITR